MVYVTPTTVLGADGALRDVVSPLTTPVTIPSAERNAADTMQAILDEVDRATGLRITLGWVRFLPTQMVTFAASREPARDALARLFVQLGGEGSLSYRLLFDPVPDKMRIFDYTLNVRPVSHAAPAPVTSASARKPPVPGAQGSGPSGTTNVPH